MKLVKVCMGALLAVTACGNDHDGSALETQLAQVRSVPPADANVSCGQPNLPPPVVAPQPLNMWPPNHKFHTFAPSDCVGDVISCDPNLHAVFLWASSDEPVDDKGDGHFAPDILFDGCDGVQLRSERQGSKDGRVYKLGVRVVDSNGVSTDSVCTVVVDHDQRGVVSADSGESYRVTLDGTAGLPLCDGRVPTDAGAPSDAGAPPTTTVDAGDPYLGF